MKAAKGALKELSSQRPFLKTGVGDFIGEVKAELKKISWTAPDEMRLYIRVVILTTLVWGMGTYLTDLAIQRFLDGVDLFYRLLFG